MADSSSAFRAGVKERYAYSTWAAKSRTVKGALGRKFFPGNRGLSGFQLVRRRARPERVRGERHAVTELFAPTPPGDVLFAVTTQEFESVAEAHEALVDALAGCMAILPEAKDKGLDVGDVAYGGHSDTQEAIFFTRYNVFIRIHNVGKKSAAVNTIAAVVDAEILDHQQGK